MAREHLASFRDCCRHRTGPMVCDYSAGYLIGKKVCGADGRLIGSIVDILIDQSQHAIRAIIDLNITLGTRQASVAVDIAALHAPISSDGSLRLLIPQSELEALPEHRRHLERKLSIK